MTYLSTGLGCIPNRQGISPLLEADRQPMRNVHFQYRRIASAPAGCGDLQHARILECVEFRIKVRAGPDGRQIHGTDTVRVGSGLDIDCIAYRRQFSPSNFHSKDGLVLSYPVRKDNNPVWGQLILDLGPIK
jgi:hypothetical protein